MKISLWRTLPVGLVLMAAPLVAVAGLITTPVDSGTSAVASELIFDTSNVFRVGYQAQQTDANNDSLVELELPNDVQEESPPLALYRRLSGRDFFTIFSPEERENPPSWYDVEGDDGIRFPDLVPVDSDPRDNPGFRIIFDLGEFDFEFSLGDSFHFDNGVSEQLPGVKFQRLDPQDDPLDLNRENPFTGEVTVYSATTLSRIPVSEPSTMVLALIGGIGIAWARKPRWSRFKDRKH